MYGQASRGAPKKNSVAILGFGREGQSLLTFIEKNPRYLGSDIWILDRDPSIKNRIDKKRAAKIHFQLGSKYLKSLSRFDLIFRSPGIPYTLPALYRARCDGTVVSSLTRLFFETINLLPASKRPTIIGVTGTKGKGTTTTLIYEFVRGAGRKAVLAGNIGKPALDVIKEASKADVVVLELSSFQLQDFPYALDVAVVLDVFPDHLDQHHSLREYYGSKANVGRSQRKSDAIFYFANNPLSKSVASKSPAKKFPIKPKTDGIKKNYEMASAVARFLKIPDSVIEKTTKSFRGLEHRLELVQTKSGISFFNDSAATNPEAVAAAIRTIHLPLVLIAGGKDKNLDYRPLREAIKESPHVRTVILIGENKKKIRTAIKSISGINIQEEKDFSTAVSHATDTAKKLSSLSNGNAAVLFSPGAASFDMFESYAHRGQEFKNAVRRERAQRVR